MRKALANAVVVASLLLCGCAQSVSGSIETVVDECQEFTTDANVKVTVTGRVDGDPYISDDGSRMSVTLADWGEGYVVHCTFDGTSEELVDDLYGRVTIEGTLSNVLSDSSISIRHCTLR